MENGIYNGNGTQYYDNGKIKSNGIFKNGKYNGNVTLYYENGIIQYEREWKNNMKNGYGRLNYKNGYKKYVGNWKNDKEDGNGTKYFLNYDNLLENNDRCEDFFPQNEDDIILNQKEHYNKEYEHKCYEGQWNNGTKTGKGEYYYFNGVVKYSGDWKNDKKHGKGELRDNNGRLLYYGDFIENKMHGYGNLYKKNVLYYGNFENDIYNGYGSLENKKEKYIISGYFLNGKLNGKEIIMELTDLRKFLFKGPFLNGVPDGKFTFFSDQEEITAIFKNGKRISHYIVKSKDNHTFDMQEENSFMKEIFNKYSIFKCFQL